MRDGRLLTRKELLTYGALGLLGCACGRSHQQVASAGGSPVAAALDAPIGGPAMAGQMGERLTPPTDLPRPFVPGELIVSIHTDQPIISFTFDDGPWPSHTQAIMNIFKGRGLEGLATFFWIGNNVLGFPEIAREVVDRGYPIANHSLTHRYYSPSILAREIAPAQDAINSVVGIRPAIFRSPGLTRGDAIQQRLAQGNMCNIFTETDLRDWVSPRLPPDQLIRNFARTVRPGSIVLLHDGGTHQQTVNAVGGMLDIARQRGLEVVPLEHLMRVGRRSSTFRSEGRILGDDGANLRDPSRADARDEHFDAIAPRPPPLPAGRAAPSTPMVHARGIPARAGGAGPLRQGAPRAARVANRAPPTNGWS